MSATTYRKTEQRSWSFRVSSAEAAMDAMEAEMVRLGHRVITHEVVAQRAPGQWRVTSFIELGATR